MLLAAFLTPLGRGFSDFFTSLGRDFRDSLLLSVLISDGLLYRFPVHALIEVSHLLKVLISGSSLLDRSSL